MGARETLKAPSKHGINCPRALASHKQALRVTDTPCKDHPSPSTITFSPPSSSSPSPSPPPVSPSWVRPAGPAGRERRGRTHPAGRGRTLSALKVTRGGGRAEGAEKDVKGAITESNSNNHVSEQTIECKQCLGIHVQVYTGSRNQRKGTKQRLTHSPAVFYPESLTHPISN